MKYTAFQASVRQAARRLMSFAALVLSVGTLHAQTTFTARIVDAETGEALPLVGVYVNEENNTLTNFDGEFSITADSADLVRLTCIGRETMMLRAGTLTPTIKMRMLTATLSEVTVTAIEGILTQVAKKTEKAFNRKKSKTAQYFYRQTSVFTQRQDIVEAFVGAHSAVNLRDLTFLTGRHGLLTKAAWERSNISDMNLHHILELGPMTFDANFWKQLTTPLPKKTTITNHINKLTYIDYFQKYYDITFEEAADGDQQLFIVHFQRREDVEIKQPVMTGTLYVDRATLNPLAFDGQVENMKLIFGKGGHFKKSGSVQDIDVRLRFPDFRHSGIRNLGTDDVAFRRVVVNEHQRVFTDVQFLRDFFKVLILRVPVCLDDQKILRPQDAVRTVQTGERVFLIIF